MTRVTIAVDAMGGDHGPSVIIPACLQVLEKHPTLHLILVGQESQLQETLAAYSNSAASRVILHNATQSVAMDESPAQALRTKKDSSMRVAVNLVKSGQANACVSAGNTGALMATARFVLKTLPGIDRPAIVSNFPTMQNKKLRMLDLGANVDSKPEHLFQFAVMGSVLATAVDSLNAPKVYLLNIGHEDIKGNELVKQTAQLLSSYSGIHYAGYIEGNQLFLGEADVVVCDGFVGNVTLKTTEGVAGFIKHILQESFSRNFLTKLIALISLPILRWVNKRIDPDRYNGATLVGLKGIVIKSHGGAKVRAFSNAIEEAIIQVEKNVPERISAEVERLLKLSETPPK